VVIAIIGIMAALGLGVMRAAREASAQAATKATIAKLNSIVMHKYESYLTRRVPIATTPWPGPSCGIDAKAWALDEQRRILNAIRDLMRMEMPDAKSDIVNGPFSFTNNSYQWSVPEPPIRKLYASNPPTADHDSAQCLYLFVSRACPEAMEQFSQNEIGTVDGKPCFVDGWGRPIMFLRWAPGYRSPIQSGDVNADHDPFDTRGMDGFAFHLVPLIYSAGPDGVYGIELGTGAFNGNPYSNTDLGQPQVTKPDSHLDNITSHVIETR
jgi:hypothetical protein